MPCRLSRATASLAVLFALGACDATDAPPADAPVVAKTDAPFVDAPAPVPP